MISVMISSETTTVNNRGCKKRLDSPNEGLYTIKSPPRTDKYGFFKCPRSTVNILQRIQHVSFGVDQGDDSAVLTSRHTVSARAESRLLRAFDEIIGIYRRLIGFSSRLNRMQERSVGIVGTHEVPRSSNPRFAKTNGPLDKFNNVHRLFTSLTRAQKPDQVLNGFQVSRLFPDRPPPVRLGLSMST